MRFKHWPKTSYVETSRKRAAAARSIQHTIDRAPLLFAARIETPQTVEERIEQNRANWRSMGHQWVDREEAKRVAKRRRGPQPEDGIQ